MFKLAAILIYAVICLAPSLSHAALQGKWNVTELVTVKTIWEKLQTQVQAQKNETTFNFNNDGSFTRTDHTLLLGAGSYKENASKRTYKVSIKNSSYSDPLNINSIKARIQANLAVRGYKVLSFKVKTNKFTGQVYNEKVYIDQLSEDVHMIQGSHSYTVSMKVAPDFASKQKQKVTIKVDSVYSGSRDATDTGALDLAIENKKKLWPLL